MADVAKAKVLIAEDDPGVLELLRIRLELDGYHTFYARDGRRAIEIAQSVHPDLVILDIRLPYLDGFGVLRAMRSGGSLQSVPLLMLTARHLAKDVQRAIVAGAQDHVTKPFDDSICCSVSRGS